MNRHTEIRVWDALDCKYSGPVTMDRAISLAEPGTHPGSCDWDIEFATSIKDGRGTPIFQGDIVTVKELFANKQRYVVRFGQARLSFGHCRGVAYETEGETTGFYLEPVPRGTLAKGDEHNRPMTNEEMYEVIGNIQENEDLLRREDE